MSTSMHPKKGHLNDILQDLKKEYLASRFQKIEKLRELTEQKKWGLLSSEYHKLKGTGKTYGFPEISLLCEKLELVFEKLSIKEQFDFLDEAECTECVSLIAELFQSYTNNTSAAVMAQALTKKILDLPLKK